MSLRVRLVALVLGLTTLLLGGFGLYLGGSLEHWSNEVLDRELDHRAEVIAAEVKWEHGELALEDEAETLGAQGWPFRIEALDGEVLTASRAWPALQLEAGSGDGFQTVLTRGGRALRVRTLRFEPRHGRTERQGEGEGEREREHGGEREHEGERAASPAGDGQAGALLLRVLAPTATFSPLLARFRVGLVVALVLALLLGALGALVLAQLLLAPLRRLSGQVAGVEASSLDTRLDTRGLDPDLGRLAEAFNGLLGRLGLAFAAQRTFVARASHALRTPLSSILTQAEVALRRERSGPEYRATLEEIATAARGSATLAEGLLALNRADAAALAARRERVPVDALADELGSLFRPRAGEAGLALEARGEPGVAVEADRSRLRELFDALLDNALRYTPRGGRVVFEARVAGGEVVLEVRDSGPGFAPGEEAQVLEPFFRGRAGEQSGQSGSGLGLAVARALALAEGGRLELGAAPEGGARITLRLPRSRTEART